jgi:DNA polymerase-3 subunit gamma/tau
MTYQVLARKYRPAAFDDVVGQDASTRTLRNALASGRIAHAYLFAGPRGIGKTTTARLLARALLCPERKASADPCGVCPACADAAASVDIIEIDAASNRRIEDIRTLRENVKYAPARGRYKVYIIDEVHQLTSDAFDALLKTLEEPPPHVVMVLATTDPRELPATILSRVQRFDFRPIAPDLMSSTLEHPQQGEGRVRGSGAAGHRARGAEGSLRDALTLLDTAIAYGNGRLEAETTAALLGTTAPAEVRAFAQALVERAHAGAGGHRPGRARRRGSGRLHARRHRAAAAGARAQGGAGREARRRAARRGQRAAGTRRGGLARRSSLRAARVPRRRRRHAGVAPPRRARDRRGPGHAPPSRGPWRRSSSASRRRRHGCASRQSPPRRRVSESLCLASSRWPSGRRAAPERAAPAATSFATAPAPAAPPTSSRPAPGPVAASGPAMATAPAAAPAPAPASEDVATGWQRVVEEVMRRKPTLGAVLAQTRPGPIRDRELSILLVGNAFHREMLSDSANRDLIGQALRRHVAGAERMSLATEGESSSGEVTDHPAVQAAVAQFQGEIVAVRPRVREGEGQ